MRAYIKRKISESERRRIIRASKAERYRKGKDLPTHCPRVKRAASLDECKVVVLVDDTDDTYMTTVRSILKSILKSLNPTC
jgi:hypothetical protein